MPYKTYHFTRERKRSFSTLLSVLDILKIYHSRNVVAPEGIITSATGWFANRPYENSLPGWQKPPY